MEPADPMLRPRKTIEPGVTRSKLDDLAAVIQREAEGAEADPFDDAMVAAVLGAAEAMKAEVDVLSAVANHLGKLARRA